MILINCSRQSTNSSLLSGLNSLPCSLNESSTVVLIDISGCSIPMSATQWPPYSDCKEESSDPKADELVIIVLAHSLYGWYFNKNN